ncbi:NUDIX hydrolase domain-like protein [Melampsora americana]|nr:NUDIX hydrolase domain-like protein [Melampsora americana]
MLISPLRRIPSALLCRTSPFKPLLMMSSSESSRKFELGTARIVNKEDLETAHSKWLGLKTINWVDEEGKERKWECTERKKSHSSPDQIDAVAVFTLVSRPNRPVQVILVLQYRPPLGKVVVELPAGLVDGKEEVEATALRELYEETGYGRGKDGGVASVEDVNTLMACNPGMTNETMALVTVRIKMESDKIPEPQPDEGEHIVVKLVDLKNLKQTLLDFKSKEGYSVDARLMHLAYGLSFNVDE